MPLSAHLRPLLPFLIAACVAACSTAASGVGDDPERGPRGKSDGSGSCMAATGDYCGEASPDGCFCDDLCASYGDCCGDVDAVCGCEPATCASQCGWIDDGCGGTLDCGPCCGPEACDGVGAECGTISDSCGDLQHCGTCEGASVCGGDGSPNVCACVPGEWTVTTLDSSGVRNISLAVDAQGGVHIAYHDDQLRALQYAYSADGVSWTTENVDDDGNAGYEVRIVVDKNGGVHIAYSEQEAMAGELRYAYRASNGTWSIAVVDEGGPIGPMGLAVDSAGGVHVGYDQCEDFELKYAHKPPQSDWLVTAVEEDAGNCGNHVDLAVTKSGELHMSYQGGSYDLMYAHKPLGLPWSKEIAASGGTAEAGAYSGLAVSDAGDVYIGYSRVPFPGAGTRRLDLAQRPVGGSWSTRLLDQNDAYSPPSLSVDPDGGVHVGHLAWTKADAHYLYSPDGDDFVSELVDPLPLAADSISLARDSAGGIHLAYFAFNNSSGQLKYAYRCP